MAKKPAKRSKAKRRMIRTYQLDIFGGKKLVGVRPAPSRAERETQLAKDVESEREWAAYFASDEYREIQAREAAARAQHRERLAARPADMRRRPYRLPADVHAFLARLHNNPLRFASIDGLHAISTDEAAGMIEAAYLRGCTEGYIEGRVADRQPRVARSKKANDAKQHVRVNVGSLTMPRLERDALMAAEYAELVKLMKPTPACQRLAAKYEFESWQGVRAAIKAFVERHGQ